MYDQHYIDSLPTYKVADVARLRGKEKLAIKHFKSELGCRVCFCTVKTVSSSTKAVECANCLKQFKGLDLPVRLPSKTTAYNQGLYGIKLSPNTCGGVNARITRAERCTKYAIRQYTERSPLPVVFGGMNTK